MQSPLFHTQRATLVSSTLHFRSITDAIPKAPFPDSTCRLALEYPSWYTRTLHAKFLMFSQLPHRLLVNNSSNTEIVITNIVILKIEKRKKSLQKQLAIYRRK